MSEVSKPPHIDMMRSPLGRARGLGAAGGVDALVGATRDRDRAGAARLWFIWSMIRLAGGQGT